MQTYTEYGPIWVMIQTSKNKIVAKTRHVETQACPPNDNWEILTTRNVMDDVLDVFVPVTPFQGICLDGNHFRHLSIFIRLFGNYRKMEKYL